MGTGEGRGLGTLGPVTKKALLRRMAREEFDEAGDWYEARRKGLGAAFAAAVQQTFERIAAQPQRSPIALRDIRKALVPGYPYCVYFRERPATILVLAVFHSSRDPALWQSRC